MIYIEKDSISIQIPRHYRKFNPSGRERLHLYLYNPATQKEYYFVCADYKDYDLIYNFENLDFSNLENGEYEFRLNDGMDNIETGIIQVGKFKNTNKQYEYKKEGIVYGG